MTAAAGTALEQVEREAWSAQYTGLAEVAPSLGPLAVEVAGLWVHGVAGWPDSAWHNTISAPCRESAPPAPRPSRYLLRCGFVEAHRVVQWRRAM